MHLNKLHFLPHQVHFYCQNGYLLFFLSIYFCLNICYCATVNSACAESNALKNDIKNFALPSFLYRQRKRSSNLLTATVSPTTRPKIQWHGITKYTANHQRVLVNTFNQERVPLVRLTRNLLAPHRYDVRVRPVLNHTQTLKIHISMSCKFKFFIFYLII